MAAVGAALDAYVVEEGADADAVGVAYAVHPRLEGLPRLGLDVDGQSHPQPPR